MKISLIPEEEKEVKVIVNYMIYYFSNPMYEVRIRLLSNEGINFMIPNSKASEIQGETRNAESFAYQ